MGGALSTPLFVARHRSQKKLELKAGLGHAKARAEQTASRDFRLSALASTTVGRDAIASSR